MLRSLTLTTCFIGTALALPPKAPSPPVAKPHLSSVSPAQSEQGNTLLLTITGTNIPKDAVLQFTPSSGIRVLSSSASSSEIRAQIQIDTLAQTGQRQVGIHSNVANATGAISFRIVPAVPVLLKVTPNQVAAGSKGVELKIEGRNFAPGARITFNGHHDIFTPDPVVFVNATEIHVSIDVLRTALTGGRDVIVKNPTNGAGTGKGILNILAPGKTPAKPVARRQAHSTLAADEVHRRGTLLQPQVN